MDYDKIKDTILEGVREIAEEEFDGYEESLIQSSEEFLEDIKEELKVLMEQHANGELTKLEFKSCLRQKKGKAKMHALLQIGVTQVKLERFRRKLIDLVVSTVTDAIL